MSSIPERLSRLRLYMKTFDIELCIIPTSDYHQSEYVADYFKYRAYLSGFSGSAGTLAVTQDEARLWTDSRYFLQAEQQLQGSGIALMKMRTPGFPTLHEWIATQQPKSIGIDAEVFSVSEVNEIKNCITWSQGRIDCNFKSYEAIWKNRPALPQSPVFLLEESISGESTQSKLTRIRQKMAKTGSQTYLLCALDEIAWAFNLRGSDIAYNPVALCYAMIGLNDARLYIDADKVNQAIADKLAQDGISIFGYQDFAKDVQNLPLYNKVCFDASKINGLVFEMIPQKCEKTDNAKIISHLKAIKNATELEGTRSAMIKDGVCFVRFWKQLEEKLQRGEQPGEYELAEALAAERLKQSACVGESFDAIVAFGANGAIVHYSPQADTEAKVRPDNILLIDHGGQYNQNGTTDMTRTLALYKNKEDIPQTYLKDYAAVLKGNIALALAEFPEGTRGCQLDVLARQFLWKQACNYGHGTGHGIGHFLNVHEGPQSIRMEENPVNLQVGMILSNEPGLYKSGEYGIRLETMMVVEERQQSDFGRFFGFETLTVCPWDINSIAKEYYTEEEIKYLNKYHQTVYQKLAPYLNEEEKLWLQEKTKQL